MRKSTLFKLLALALCAAMLLSLFACGPGEQPITTEPTTEQEQEKPGEETNDTTTTEATTQADTEDNSTVESDDGEESKTEAGGEESETVAVDVESKPTVDEESETVAVDVESKPTVDEESETNAGEVVTTPQPDVEVETLPQQPDVEVETKPGVEVETEPACDGNHNYVAKGQSGHYCDKCGVPGRDNPIIAHEYEDNNGVPTCTVCGYEAACKGVHNTFNGDENGHWTAPCADCGAEAGTEILPHTFEHSDGKYACIECYFVLTCEGKHALVDDGEEGHHTVACEICNVPEGEKVPHEYVNSVCACGNEAACKGQHAWVKTAEGHSSAACTICGMPATENEPHTEDGSDYIVGGNYVYGCKICGYAKYTKALTEAVKAFYGPVALGASKATYYQINHTVKTEESGLVYASFTGKNSAAQVLWMRAHGDTSYQSKASESEQGKLDIGNATLLVIKLRASNAEQKINFSFSTTGYNSQTAVAENAITDKNGNEIVAAGATYNTTTGYSSFDLPMGKAVAGEWTTFVVDLAKVVPTQMVLDSETNTYVVDSLFFTINSFADTDTLDVAYMAFVEGSWTDVGANVEEETAVSVTGSGYGSVVDPDTGACAGEHNLATVLVDGEYKSACACGYVKSAYGIKEDGPNKLWGAETIATSGSVTGKIDKTLMYDEDGTAFVRLDNFWPNRDNWGDFSIDLTKYVGKDGASGRYIVIKYRVGNSGNGTTNISVFANTNKGGAGTTGLVGAAGTSFAKTNDNEWHTVVIDLGENVSDPSKAFVADDDGTYTVRYLSIRPFTGGAVNPTDEGEGRYCYHYSYTKADGGTGYVVSYNEPFSNEEIAEKGYTLVKTIRMGLPAEAYVDFSYVALCDSVDDIKNIVTSETYQWSVDGSTSVDRNTADNSCATHSYKETVDGTTHTVACTSCGDVLRSFELSADVNYYADLSSMNFYNNDGTALKKLCVDEEAGLIYNAFEATQSTHWNLTGGGGAGSYTKTAYKTGEYVVIKYRAGGEADTTMTLYLGTGDKGLSNTSASSIGTLTAKAGDGWKVAVVKINSPVDAKEGYTIASEQTLYFMGMPGGDRKLDVAFLAVVDSIDEMKTLLGENETYVDFGDSLGNIGVEYDQEGNKVPCKEGKCETDYNVTVTDGENGAKIYSYICVKCGVEISSRIVPANAEFIYPELIKTPVAGNILNKEETDKSKIEVEKDVLNITNPYHANNTKYAIANGAPYVTFNGSQSKADAEKAFREKDEYKDYTDEQMAALLISKQINETTQLIWNRSYEDLGGNLNSNEMYTLDLGQAKYFVVRVNASIAAATAYPGCASISISTAGAAKCSSIILPVADFQNVEEGTSEWVTYVVDLSTATNKWVKNETTGTYILDSFYFHIDHFINTDSFSIEYMAFVDSWADVETLVGDDEKIAQITESGSAKYQMIDFGNTPGSSVENAAQVVFVNDVAKVTVPAGMTMYYSVAAGIPEGMQLFADGEMIEFVAGETAATFAITNDSESDRTYELVIASPKGSEGNPDSIEAIDDLINSTLDLVANGSYFYTFTVTDDGTIAFNTENGEIAVTIGETTETSVDGKLTVDVKAGDVLVIKVTAAADGEFAWSGSLTYPEGSEKNPIALTDKYSWDDDNYVASCDVEVAEGTTAYFQIGLENVNVFVNNQAYEAVDGIVVLTANATIRVEYIVGSSNRPFEIVNGDNSVEVGATDAYYLVWTATETGKIVITAANANYQINGGDAAAVTNDEIAVNAGDVVTVVISSAEATTVVVNVKFIVDHVCVSDAAYDCVDGKCTEPTCGKEMKAVAEHGEADEAGKCPVCGTKYTGGVVVATMTLNKNADGAEKVDDTTFKWTGVDGNVTLVYTLGSGAKESVAWNDNYLGTEADCTLTISATQISKIVFTATSSSHANRFVQANVTEGAALAVDGVKVTLTVTSGTLDEIVLSFTGTGRINSMEITFIG